MSNITSALEKWSTEKLAVNKKRINSDDSEDLDLLDKTKKSKYGDTPPLDDTAEGSDNETTSKYRAKMVWSEETASDDDAPMHHLPMHDESPTHDESTTHGDSPTHDESITQDKSTTHDESTTHDDSLEKMKNHVPTPYKSTVKSGEDK